MRSDVDDHALGGRAVDVTGEEALPFVWDGTSIRFDVAYEGDTYQIELAQRDGEVLRAGYYPDAGRYPYDYWPRPGIRISRNDRPCQDLSGRFEVSELELDTARNLVRFSAIFEQRCRGASGGLRGAVHYRARGRPDVRKVSDATIPLLGKIARLAYDERTNVAYGLDESQPRIARIDLSAGSVSYVDVAHAPSDACIDRTRNRLFVVNSPEPVSEYALDDLSLVREFEWHANDWPDPFRVRFHIACAKDRLFLSDEQTDPALRIVDGLDAPNPAVSVRSWNWTIGAFAITSDGTWFYTAPSPGPRNRLTAQVTHGDTLFYYGTRESWSYTDPMFRDPVEAPILLDEGRGYVFYKNRMYDSANVERELWTLPVLVTRDYGAAETAYAIDAERGLLATRSHVYDLDTLQPVSETLTLDGSQMFFDREGHLRFLVPSRGTLETQVLDRL